MIVLSLVRNSYTSTYIDFFLYICVSTVLACHFPRQYHNNLWSVSLQIFSETDCS